MQFNNKYYCPHWATLAACGIFSPLFARGLSPSYVFHLFAIGNELIGFPLIVLHGTIPEHPFRLSAKCSTPPLGATIGFRSV